MPDRELELTKPIPVVYFSRRDGLPPDPVPYLLTETDLIRFTQLDLSGVEHPERTVERYRSKGMLRFVQVGRVYCYTLPDVIEFLHRLQGSPPDRN